MRVTSVYRYARGPGIDRPTVDGFPNYHHLTASVDGVKALLESGINPVREVKAADGIRRPVIGIRSSPWKAGTEATPWHDVFDLEHGRVRYFGDHKISTPGPLGSTTGNAALLEAWTLHRGYSRADRLLATPLMIFRAVRANGAVKGYVQFCGVVIIEGVDRVVQRDPQTGLDFPNYVFDLVVVDTSREADEVDWRWIDDRRDPSLSLEQTLRFAPAAWREWVAEGTPDLSKIRRRKAVPVADLRSADRRSPTSSDFDDDVFSLINQAVCPGQVIKTLGKARPNRIVSIDRDGLRVETDRSIREGEGPQLVPAWMVNAAWQHLSKHGRLSQSELLDDLNVKRSAFVCALLAHFPGVEVGEDGNIVLRLASRARDDFDLSELIWPTVRESSDSGARPYTATGRAGKVNVRHFRQAMTHAMDVDGLIWSFFPSAEEAKAHVGRKIAEGYDAMVVPAKLYVPSERPLPRPEGRGLRPTPGGGGDLASWQGSAIYAARLNDLFDTVRSADGTHHTSEDVAQALQADGLAVHPDSIARLRAGTAARPSDGLSFALAFFFDVDPDYFFDQSEEDRAERDPTSVADGALLSVNVVSDFQLSQTQFVRVLAGLTQATSRCLEAQTANQPIVSRLALIITDAGVLMLESMSGEVLVPTRLVERIMNTWAETNPADNGTESDYQWAADTFRMSSA